MQNNLSIPDPTHGDFHWPIGQHGLRITERQGSVFRLLTFNNQASFIFDGPGSTDNASTPFDQGDLGNDRSDPPYSMIIEYEIDEDAGTVRQVWGYGHGEPRYYASFTSGINLVAGDHRLTFSNGYDSHDPSSNPSNPHVIEFDPSGEIVLQLEIIGPEWLAHNAGKVDLYHPER